MFFPGATWKRKTMFAPSFINNNFETILLNAGVGLSQVEYDVSDTHESILSASEQLYNQHDFIFGYSYGCLPALKHANANTNIKGIILLDPSALPNNQQQKYIIEIEEANKNFAEDMSVRNKTLWDKYPRIDYSNIRCKVLVVYSEYGINNKSDGVKIHFLQNKKVIVINESSHYIMMEPKRFELANHILEFINGHA